MDPKEKAALVAAAQRMHEATNTVKPTPGPWRVNASALFKEGGQEINPNLPRSVCAHCRKPAIYEGGEPAYQPASIGILAKGWGVATLLTMDPVGEFAQHMANARLIAAAPDLLAALEACAHHMANVPNSKLARGHADAMRAAFAAIARAKGTP